MRALLVDAGNTRITCAAWEDASALPVNEASAPAGLSPAVPLTEWAVLDTPRGGAQEREFNRSFAAVLAKAGRPPVVLVTTVPRVAGLLADLAVVIEVDHRAPLPFSHRLERPDLTGPDRFCNVAAAAAAGLVSALIVDAGTATTVDVLRDSVHLGGVIAPGMAFAARCLGDEAARLAPVDFAPVPLEVGRDTEAAMAAGGFHAGVGGVEALITGLQRRHGPLPVILTGGLGIHLLEENRHHDLHWTLRGAAVLAGLA